MDECCESRIPRSQLRKLMLERRSEIDAETRTGYDLAIACRLEELPQVREARVLAVYWPIRHEPDLRSLAPVWRAAGKSLALPVMGAPDGGLLFCPWRDDGDLQM